MHILCTPLRPLTIATNSRRRRRKLAVDLRDEYRVSSQSTFPQTRSHRFNQRHRSSVLAPADLARSRFGNARKLGVASRRAIALDSESYFLKDSTRTPTKTSPE